MDEQIIWKSRKGNIIKQEDSQGIELKKNNEKTTRQTRRAIGQNKYPAITYNYRLKMEAYPSPPQKYPPNQLLYAL